MARKRRIGVATDRTVLLVDDNHEFLLSSQKVVARAGHRVLVASGGVEALALLRADQVDLIVIDYFMPGMTGEQFVLELRRFDTTTPVILQTGYANGRPPRELLEQLDIQGYHDKNDGPAKLLLWVDAGLDGRRTPLDLEIVDGLRP